MTTLAQRVQERMATTGITNAQLAKAAGVKPPTSFNWATGKTKQIKAGPLLRVAPVLGVTPGWLNTGDGPKYPDSTTQLPPASQPYPQTPIATLLHTSQSVADPSARASTDSIAHHIAGLAHYLVQMDHESLKDAAYALSRLAENPALHPRAAALFTTAFHTAHKKVA